MILHYAALPCRVYCSTVWYTMDTILGVIESDYIFSTVTITSYLNQNSQTSSYSNINHFTCSLILLSSHLWSCYYHCTALPMNLTRNPFSLLSSFHDLSFSLSLSLIVLLCTSFVYLSFYLSLSLSLSLSMSLYISLLSPPSFSLSLLLIYSSFPFTIYRPMGVTVDVDNILYIADSGNNAIRRLDLSSKVSLLLLRQNKNFIAYSILHFIPPLLIYLFSFSCIA